MVRTLHLFLLATMATALGQPERPDPAFEKIPFEEWLKGGGQARIQWYLGVRPPSLSEWQRLEMYIRVDVAERELVKRPERGQMVAYLDIRDLRKSDFSNSLGVASCKGSIHLRPSRFLQIHAVRICCPGRL